MSALNVLCAQLTRDLFAIAKFLLPTGASFELEAPQGKFLWDLGYIYKSRKLVAKN